MPFEGLHVVTAGMEGRAIVHGTDRALPLTATEIYLLSRGAGEERIPSGQRAAALHEKLAELGFPFPEGWADSPVPDVAAPLIDDRTPLFRRDLVVEPAGTARVRVTDLVTGKTARLYDFEVSLARCLDASRAFHDMLEAAKRLGIPCSLESAGLFLGEMATLGFVIPLAPGAKPGPDMSRRTRQVWDEETRALYQSALRLVRQGRHTQARARLATLARRGPDLAETREVFKRAQDDRSALEILEANVAARVPLVEHTEERATLEKVRGVLARRPGVTLGVVGALVVLTIGFLALRRPSRALPEPAPRSSPQALLTTPAAAEVEARSPSVRLPPPPAAEPGPELRRPPSRLLLAVADRNRPVVARVLAPLGGTVRFVQEDPYRISSGDVAVRIDAHLIWANEAGWLFPSARTDARVKSGQLLATIRAREATGKALLRAGRPKAGWRCSVFGEGTDEHARCVVRDVKKTSKGHWVTFTVEPTWFDFAESPKVFLAP